MRRITSAAELAALSKDAGIFVIAPARAYVVESEREVSHAVREAAGDGLSVTPRGGGTSIPTQSVGSGAILVQARASIRLTQDTVVCEPGVVKADLNRELSKWGRWMPVDPSSYASCTVGGMVANNSSGARTLKYGSTADSLAGARVVLADGRALALGPATEEALSGDPLTRKAASLILENQKEISEDAPRATKNSSGYRLEKVRRGSFLDLQKLFAGSEGTLGVITEATLKTRLRPKWRALFVAESTLHELDAAVAAFRTLAPSALELVDKSVFRSAGRWERVSRLSRSDDPFMIFCELDGDDGGLEEEAAGAVGGLDPLLLTDEGDISAAWEARNETLTFAQDMVKGGRRPVPGVEDLAVPPGALGDLVELLVGQFERRGLEYILYGHAGDANLHARPLLDLSEPSEAKVNEGLMEDCFEEVWKMGGSMTGEHGDGMLRAKYVPRQYPRTYHLMEELKAMFDPKVVMNPGVKIART
ncbi:MAG: FAD-binding oxidoreductase [Nitrososphaerota archaeon]|nr:FAD-binding oxidoreductase [Nitrososphaerota archaeon]MDG6941921.1 FAD-binding oxidoreductase [Nitrososphaerota archaeon]MDG6946906.1 FAD-binding oxidoreductase [Nitrososphaerota archaeon]